MRFLKCTGRGQRLGNVGNPCGWKGSGPANRSGHLMHLRQPQPILTDPTQSFNWMQALATDWRARRTLQTTAVK